MRRFLNILSILILLTLGVELCSAYGAGGQGAASCLVCIVDDDVLEFSSETPSRDALVECDFLGMAGVCIPARTAKMPMLLSAEEEENVGIWPGVRRHRWLCRECC